MITQMNEPCIFSPCGRYRYTLHRRWGEKNTRTVMFLLLNPSTADDEQLDPTLRRCQNYARSWGFGQMWIANLFAYRSPSPKAMKMMEDPVGEWNDLHIMSLAYKAKIIVCGWGNGGAHRDRAADVLGLLSSVSDRLHYLARTKQGEPGHPLYLKSDLVPQRFSS